SFGTSVGSDSVSRNVSDRNPNRHARALYRIMTCGVSRRSRSRIFIFHPRLTHGSARSRRKGTTLLCRDQLSSNMSPLFIPYQLGHFVETPHRGLARAGRTSVAVPTALSSGHPARDPVTVLSRDGPRPRYLRD